MRFRAEGRFPRVRKLAVSVLRRFGVHPVTVERLFEGTAKGDWIAEIRRFTGEAPALAPGQILYLGTSVAEPYLGRGWHRGEGKGRWTATGTAEILFSVAAGGTETFALELAGHTLRLPETVAFALNGAPALSHHFERRRRWCACRFRCRCVRLSITVPAPTSPSRLTGAPDPRTLGFWVSELRLTNT